MLIVKSDESSEAGTLPDEKLLIAMGKFNEEMVKAGVMLAGEGLQPSSKGARIKFTRGKPTKIDGPFSEAKELVGGFWVIQVKSKEEAIAWASRVPFETGEIEVRQVAEASDFEPAIKTEAGRQALAAEAQLRAKTAKQ
jgi:hypothetical protein